jgi:hypothetical protein
MYLYKNIKILYIMMKKGGNGAAEYGSYVWGTNQQSVSGSGNLIQAVGDPNQYKGGKKKEGGNGVLTAAAVPAVLIAANHFYNPRSRKNKYKKGGAGLSTQDQLATLTNNINQIQTQILPQVPSGTIHSNSSETTTYTGTYSGGSGVLETLAVPAVLLTANHLYRPRYTQRKNRGIKKPQKRGKRSRMYSVKKR